MSARAGRPLALVGLLLAPIAAARPARIVPQAQAHDCAAYRNSPLREPAWYARECLGASGAPRPHSRAPRDLAGETDGLRTSGDTAYQLNLRTFAPVVNPSTFQSFSLPGAVAPTVLGAQTRELLAMDFDDVTKTLYAIDNATRQLGTLDKTNGAFTALGTLVGLRVAHVITGLTIDPRNGAFYVSATDSLVSTLYTLDRATFTATPVGNIGFEQIIDIAIDCNGQIYGHDIVDDVLVRIDPATGAGSLLGPTGFDANFAQGMDFDNSDGKLYGWLYQGGGASALVTFDLLTGAATSVSTPPAGEYEGAIPNCCFAAKGNFNRDKHADLVFRNTTSNRHVLWMMDGVTRTLGTFVVPDPPSADWRAVLSDDFESAAAPGTGPDGVTDLVFQNQVTRAIEFWLMDGANRVGSPRPLTGAAALVLPWELAASGDFDKDGKPDLVWRNTSTQKLLVWLMNGTQKAGELVPTPDQAADSNWSVVAALDYNHDGHRDLLWYNSTTGKIVLWFLDANLVRIVGQFTNPPNAGDSNWKVVAGGDYSASTQSYCCTPDVVWRNDTSGKLVVWHMDTAGNRLLGQFTVPDAPSNPTQWLVAGPK